MNDIAICGKSTRFCRMLELELRAAGYSVTREPNGGSFRLWIMDLDTCTIPEHRSDRICLGITENEAALSDEQRGLCRHIFPRPLHIEHLREEVSLILSTEMAISPSRSPQAHLRLTERGFVLDGEPLVLTETEHTVLQALYDQRGQTVPRDTLCRLLGNETNAKLADVYICLLRKKLEVSGTPRMLFTVRGLGYRLERERHS